MPDDGALTGPAPRVYRVPAFLRFSAAAHVAGLGAVVASRATWPAVVAGLVLDHLFITYGGLWPKSVLVGPNIVRLPPANAARGEVALTIDDGPDPAVTPAVLDLLDRAGARATFFCIGRRAERHPELVREIAARGHEIGNHSWSHLHRFFFLAPAALRREVGRAQELLGDLAGRAPEFFRAPAGIRSPLLEPVLASFGLRLASWTRRGFDTATSDAARVLARLTHRLGAGDILLLHDGNLRLSRSCRPVVVDVLPALVDEVRRSGFTVVTLGAGLHL